MSERDALVCRSTNKLAALSATDAQLTADLANAKVQLQQADQKLRAACQSLVSARARVQCV